ncbi:MAG: formylglycine-generating enzyme family protein [Leptospirillia bacterium]
MTVNRLRRLCVVMCLFVAGGCAHMPMAKAPDNMVLIPAGPFIMGTDQTDDDIAEDLGLPYTWYADARPARQVVLPAFYIDRYEMTNAEYLQFMNVTEIPLGQPYGWDDDRPQEGTNDYPVSGLNWYEAYLVCQHFGKRLPTEAEWEKAARGPDGARYPWGDEWNPELANVARGGAGRTVPVGSYPGGASPYGVHDMIGNVWEWVRDWFRPYPGSDHVSDNYGKRFKSIRGNSYAEIGHFSPEERAFVTREMSRANYRNSFDPKAKRRDAGVRCARDVEK